MNTIGKAAYPDAAQLLITADCGGSNGNRVRLWKVELAALAAETGLTIKVCQHPPGTSKMEPDREQAVQLHLDELARTSPDQP